MKMRKSFKAIWNRGCAVLLAAVSLLGTAPSREIYATEEDPWYPVVVFAQNVNIINADPGATIRLTVPVKSVNGVIENPTIDLDTKDMPLTVESDFTLRRENFVDPPKAIDTSITYIDFDLSVSETAAAGTYKPKFNFQYLAYKPNGMQDVVKYEMALPLQIKVSKASERKKANISISNLSIDRDELLPGDSFNISGTIQNKGELPAKNAQIYIDGFETEGILPDYTNQKKDIGNLLNGNTVSINYPVHVSPKATAGIKTLTVHVLYTDDTAGNAAASGSEGTDAPPATDTKDVTGSLYVEVGEKKKEDTLANLIIKEVSQSPNVPSANGKLAVSFTVENKGKVDAKEVKISTTNLTNTNFTPVRNEPYVYIKSIKAGGEKRITMNFIISDKVVEGLNEIVLKVDYKDEAGQDLSIDGNKIYVRNVMNPEDAVVGVPKLIISKFDTGGEDLRAGKTFLLSFDIFNTHSSLSADNIKLTLSSEEAGGTGTTGGTTFSVLAGSNSFYIKGIKPGETVHKEIELRIKPDCVTKSYPLTIDFEYEYEGMQKLENEISTGLKVSEKLNIQVLENSRPTVSNIIVGTWEPPQTGMPCNMGFDFYNMGKSTLFNVIARVESTDFSSTQQTKFIGNVEAGTGNTYEMELTPLVEGGDGKGTLVITYEDSNGSSYDVNTEFTAMVSSPQIMDPGMEEGMMPMPEETVKKEIVPLWVFIIIQVVLFFAGILILRKIIISVYKKKLHRQEEE